MSADTAKQTDQREAPLCASAVAPQVERASAVVVHLMTERPSGGKLARLARLVREKGERANLRHVLMAAGPALAAPLPQPAAPWRLLPWRRLPWGKWLHRNLLADGLRHVLRPDGEALILHIWDPQALEAMPTREPAAAAQAVAPVCNPCVSDAADRGSLWHATSPPIAGYVLEIEDGEDWANLPDLLSRQNFARNILAICRSQASVRMLRQLGMPADQVILAQEQLPLDLPGAAPGSSKPGVENKIRQRFGFAPDQRIVLALPPVTRAGGTYYAAWATLLIEKIHPDLRLLLPDGLDSARIERLVRSCRHEHVVHTLSNGWPLPELLGCADLALFLPLADVPLFALRAAVAAGLPLVVTDNPLVREFIPDQQAAWFCRPRDPKDAARALLQALEQPEESRRRAERAQRGAPPAPKREQASALYARLFETGTQK